MSTRGCLIRLQPDVCKIAYLHYGADFVSENIYQEGVGEEFWDAVFDAAKEWDEFDGGGFQCYQEVTDPESIQRLYRYDTDFIEMDAVVFIFVEFKPRTEHCIALYDVTIKRQLSVEGDWWKEEWDDDPEQKDSIRKYVGVKNAKKEGWY